MSGRLEGFVSGCGGESDRVEFRIGKSSTLTPRLTARLAEAYAIMRTCAGLDT